MMKRMLSVAFVLLMIAGVAAAQMNANKGSKAGKNSVEDQLISLEKQAWEAWKNKNGSFFQTFLSDDAVLISGSGVEGKAASVQAISNMPCEVKSYALDNFKVTMIDKNTALLTYSAKQDFTCQGKAGPPQIWASSVFVKRGGKWLNFSHQESAPEPGM